MEKKKLIKVITLAITNLENSIEAHGRSDNSQNELHNYIWKAAAYSEYTLFLLSLMMGKKLEASSWKSKSHPRQMEEKNALMNALALLKEARESIEANNLHKSYKKTWISRGCLLFIQNIFEKKRQYNNTSKL